MKINDNGIVRDMTPEEIAEHEKFLAELPPPVPSPDEQNRQRIEELEIALMELADMMTGGV